MSADQETVNVLEQFNQLSPEKRALLVLQALRSKRDKPADEDLTIPRLSRVEGTNSFPPSFAQHRLWFLQQLEPDSAVYNIPAAVRLLGPVDVGALELSLKEIVRRHEVLRTTFVMADGEVRQVVAPELDLPLDVVDLRDCAEPRAEATRLATEDAWRPFDLASSPPLRITLFRLDEEEYVVLLIMHHIVSDAWSTGILVREVTALYEAFSSGNPSPLAELPIQYSDFSVWQRGWLQGGRLESQLEYWRNQLGGTLPALELPSDRPRQIAQTFHGATYRFTLPRSLSDALKWFSHREDVTLFMTLIAAFKVLLYRYTQQEDILVGTPVAGRNRAEIEGLIGFFVNTLVLRTDLSGNPTFRELVARVRKVAVDAYSHENLPFEKIIEEIQPERYLNRTPLLPVLFVLQNAPMEALKLAGLTLTPFDAIVRTQTFDELYLSMFESEEGLKGSLEYKTGLYDEATIKRMMAHYQRLLESIVRDGQTPIADLNLFTEAEQEQLQYGCDRTRRAYPACNGVHGLFENTAEHMPGAIAVVFEDEKSTYGELNKRANEVAHRLLAHGVGPDSLVGIMMNRSVDMVAGVLAALKAGGSYLPLDPAYPRDRLQFMIEDANVKVLLTQSNLLASVPECGARVFCLDGELASQWRATEEQSEQNPNIVVSPDNAAYVIYTSGSTGRPKGVVMPHGPLLNLMAWQRENLKWLEGIRTLQFASLCFDVSFQELFSTWSTGGTLVLMNESVRRDGAALLRLLKDREIDRLLLPFAALQRLADTVAGIKGPLHLKLSEIITSGEQLQITAEVAELFERLGDCTLYNQYGPTEAHVVTAAELGGEPFQWPRLPSIGTPIANTEVLILDEKLRAVPVGVAGELFIGGVCLSRGYLGRPDLTGERFIPHPFSSRPGARLYKTGDLARCLQNGEIEILGRIDHQVKVRGYRIELGEIEAVLDSHPAIRKSLLLVREDAQGDRRLVAYLMANPEEALSAESQSEGAYSRRLNATELRRFLQAKVPEYMMPSAFVYISEWPLTPSGKINRRALPAPGLSRPALELALVEPRSTVEELLRDIWCSVLRLESVGVYDNFLELGGDSILSIKLVSRANRAGFNFTLTQFWQEPTIAALAELAAASGVAPQHEASLDSAPLARPVHLETDTAERRAISDFTLAVLGKEIRDDLVNRHGEIEDLYSLSPMQQGILFHALFNRKSAEYVEQFSCELSGELNLVAFRRSWEEVIRRHPVLRTAFVWEGLDEPVQVVYKSVPLALTQHDWRPLSSHRQQVELDAFVEAEERAGDFELTRPPLMRLVLIRLSDDVYHFVWSFHDVVLDGWSGPLILEEVNTLYEAFCKDAKPELGQVYPFRDFIEWMQRQDASKAEAFWRRRLEGFTQPTHISVDRVGGALHSEERRYDKCRIRLSKETSAALQSFARQNHLTLNTVAQGAWALLLSRYSDEEDVVFGAVVSGRPADLTGVESMVGVLVNTLPVRTQVPAGALLIPWLKGIQSEQIETRQHEYSPLVQIHKWAKLEPGRRLFESILAFVNYPDGGGGMWLNKSWSLQKSGYPLFVMVRPDAEILIEITYSVGHFEADSIRRMLAHFRTLLERISADLARRIGDLDVLSEPERRLLISDLNDSGVDFALDTSFQDHFEAQAGLAPGKVACVDRDCAATYAELNLRANRLFELLDEKGVRSETIVALFAERGVDFLSMILGVFKAGAAYLPLDPLHPHERIAQILADSGASFVVAQKPFIPLIERALAGFDRRKRPEVIRIEQIVGHAGDAKNLPSRGCAGNLAYVIYTSGSTGVPKGAMIEQCGMLNHLFAKVRDLGLTAEDVLAQTASQCFDISVWQFLAASLVGATVHVVDDECAQRPARLLDAIESAGVTIFETVPSMLRALLEEIEDRGEARPSLSKLRWIILTGEALQPELCRQWLSHYPAIPMLNAYGPTECSDDVTHFEIRESLKAEQSSIPIGRPVANMRLYVLNRNLQPMPVNQPGELYVGGIGVGRGYLNDAGRTSEAFLPDPFSTEAGARLYRTGDLARLRATGEIEYVGRIDNQVKIRGHRIELGEIEAALADLPAIKSSVVDVREDNKGDKHLAAYVVLQPGASATGVRDRLKKRLPGYMIPSNVVVLDALPLTTNGKIDRKALALPGESGRGEEEQDFVAARTPAEATLAGIWLEVLKIDRVSVTSNFFELGGHSLIATQVFSRIQSAFDVEVPLRTIFDKPTIAELAMLIEEMLIRELDEISDWDAERLLASES